MVMPFHIGIVACSAEGAALCYRIICAEGAKFLGPHAHPEVSMHTHSLAEYVKCFDRNDWQSVGELMLASASKLAQIGADFLICPDNTIHQALPYVEPSSPVPWLHIAEIVVGRGCRARVPAPRPHRNAVARGQRGLSRESCRARAGVCAPDPGRTQRDQSHHHG
jgi:hypothetical protein